MAKTFAQALCERFGCPPEQYLRVALMHTLYPQARLAFRLLPLSYARADDVRLLEAAKTAATEEQLEELVRDYWYHLHLGGGVLARCLKLRVSGERLKRLFRWVMGPE